MGRTKARKEYPHTGLFALTNNEKVSARSIVIYHASPYLVSKPDIEKAVLWQIYRLPPTCAMLTQSRSLTHGGVRDIITRLSGVMSELV